MSATLHRLHRKVTRGQLERLLHDGDENHWAPDENDPTRRRNGRWETWKAPSRVVQGRRDCFIRNLRSGAVRSGKSWQELAAALGVGRWN